MSPVRTVALGLVLVGWGSPSAFAQEAKAKTTALNVDLGFVNASGNTSVTTLNLSDKFVASTPNKRVVFTQLFNVVRSQTDGVKNAEALRAQLRLDYGLGGDLYLFGFGGWDRNLFAGVSRRFEETVGLSFRALSSPNDDLAFEVGLSLFQQRNAVAAPDGARDDNFTAGRLAGTYKRKLTGTSFLTESLELIPNFNDRKDFRLNSETGLVAPISTRIGLKLGYSIRYDNLPGLAPPPNPGGARLKKTDRFLTAGITVAY